MQERPPCEFSFEELEALRPPPHPPTQPYPTYLVHPRAHPPLHWLPNLAGVVQLFLDGHWRGLTTCEGAFLTPDDKDPCKFDQREVSWGPLGFCTAAHLPSPFTLHLARSHGSLMYGIDGRLAQALGSLAETFADVASKTAGQLK